MIIQNNDLSGRRTLDWSLYFINFLIYKLISCTFNFVKLFNNTIGSGTRSYDICAHLKKHFDLSFAPI